MADWTEIGLEGKGVNLDCVFTFVGAKLFEEGAVDAGTGVVLNEENITYLVEPVVEPEPDPATPAKFQTIPEVGKPGVDLTSAYSANGIYTLVDGSLLKNGKDELGTVKINDVVKAIGDTDKGIGVANGNALWFRFEAGTTLKAGDVITAVIGEVTYTYTVTE